MKKNMRRRDFLKTAPTAAWVLAQTAKGATFEQGTEAKAKVDLEKIRTFDFGGVQLREGLIKDKFNLVRDYYFRVPNDDLLKRYRERAGLPAPGKTHGGWGGPDIGCLFSVFARMSKATGDTAARDKAVYLMDEWAKTISEQPSEGARRTGFGRAVVDGLVDLHRYVGNKDALKHLERVTVLAEKYQDRSRPYTSVGGEWYTLSESLYRAFEETGNKRYFDFAKVWEYPDFWGHFAQGEDIFAAFKNLPDVKWDPLKGNPSNKNYHAYSHVNTFSSAAMAYKVTGERSYLDTITNAYKYLQETQCFATGGYGPDENLIVPDMLPQTLDRIQRGTPQRVIYSHYLDSSPYIAYHFETGCGSWAGLKLGRYLMTLTGEAHYGDWIERLVYNGVLAMPPMSEDGRIMYGSRYHLHGAQKMNWAAWSCCTGTFPMSVAEFYNLIYFHDAQNLYVNLFVPSGVEWNGPNGSVTVTQETKYPEEESVVLRVRPKIPSRFGLKFRVPGWAKTGTSIKVNDSVFQTEIIPGKWATIDRQWKIDDTVILSFDLAPRLEPLAKYVSPVAVLCGPAVMVETTNLAGFPTSADMRHPQEWLRRSPGKFECSSSSDAGKQIFRPFYDVKEGEYYKMYFERPDGVSIPSDDLVFHEGWSSDGDLRYSEKPGDSFEGKFNGTTLVWEGLRTEDGGTAEVSIDGQKVAEVDQYGYNGAWGMMWIDQRPVPFLWSVSDMTDREHTVKVTILPNKNSVSQGTKVNVKKLTAYR